MRQNKNPNSWVTQYHPGTKVTLVDQRYPDLRATGVILGFNSEKGELYVEAMIWGGKVKIAVTDKENVLPYHDLTATEKKFS